MPAMRDPATGRVLDVPADQVEQAIRAGFSVETPAMQAARVNEEVAAERVAGLGAGAEALGAGVLRGGTLGLSDAAIAAFGSESDVDRLAELRRGRPVASLVGEVGGGVGAAIASGGTGALGTLARATPSGALAGVGTRVLGLADELGTAARIGAGIGAGAIEGAGGGAGSYITEVALEDKPLSAEAFLASAKGGALWGGVAGGALTAGERALLSARRLFPRATSTRQAAESTERAAIDEIDSAIRDGDALEAAADRRIAEIAAVKRAGDPQLDAALREAEIAPQISTVGGGRELSSDEIGALISGRGKVQGGRVVPRASDAELDVVHAVGEGGTAPDTGELEALLRQTQERVGAGETLGEIAGVPRRPDVAPAAPAARQRAPLAEVPPARPLGRVEIVDQAAEAREAMGGELGKLFGKETAVDDLAGAYRTPEGFTFKMDRAKRAESARGGVDIAGDIVADDGRIAGFIERTFRRGDDGKLEVVHRDLQLYPGFWDQGIGPVISRSSLEAYPRLGVQRIEIPQAMHVGRYYWLKQGYKPATEDVPRLLDAFRGWIRKDPELSPQVIKLMSDARRELNRPGGFAGLSVGERRIGKEFLLSDEAPTYALSVNVKPGDKWYEAVRKSVGASGEAAAPELSVIAGGAGAPSRLERELAGTLEHVKGGGSLGAAPHIAKRQALDAMDEILARADPEAKILVDAKRDLRMSAAEIRDWVEDIRRRGGAGTLSAAPRRGLGGAPTAADAAAPVAAELAPAGADDAVRSALRTPEPRLDEEARDIAQTLGRHEAANANLADGLGDLAPPAAAQRAKGYREAEAKVDERAATATERAAADLEHKTAEDPSILGRIADLGAAYEVMRALGVPLPSPSAIPVIGPVLGLYFKARAANSVFRRLGGRLPRSAESVIASHGADVRNRVARAVDGMVTVAGKAARGARAARAPRWAGVLSQRLFDDGEPAPRARGASDAELVKARVRELAKATAPGAVQAAVRERFPMADPAIVDAMTAALERRLAHLQKHAPRAPAAPTVLRGGRSDWQPTRAEILAFARRVEAATDPAAVLERAATMGEISSEAADTIRTVYPRLFLEAQMALLEKAPEIEKTLPYSRRVMLSVLFDVPLDGTTEPEYVAALQSHFAPSPPPEQSPAGAAPPVPSIAGDVRIADRATLRTDR